MRISLEITHKCNRMCKLCDHFINTSSFQGLTREDYYTLCECINPDEITEIKLIGGEPLLYPDIHWLIEQLKKDYPRAKLVIVTNGSFLNKLSDKELRLFDRIEVSLYPDNKDIIEHYINNYHNIYVNDSTEMWNPYKNQELDLATAKKIHSICYSREPRFYGTKMYGCCLAEGLERTFNTLPVHVKASKNWKEDYKKLPTWLVCQKCFRAGDINKSKSYKLKHKVGSLIRNNNMLYGMYKRLKR